MKTTTMRLIAFTIMGMSLGSAHAAKLQVLNENAQPLAGADVLIGYDHNDPYEGNLHKTDVNGAVEIPIKWNKNLPITVTAEGYLPATFLNMPPVDNVLQIHPQDARSAIEVRGETTHFENIKRDGKVDFALVYPALRRRQLTRFDVESVINPDFDVIKVITEELAIPSNLTLPEQKESYVLPITFNKPQYRMSFKQPGQYRMMAVHGQFPLKQVVGDLRDGKSFYEVINYFRILKAGQRDVTVNTPLADQNIPVNQIPLNKKLTVKAPTLAPDKVMLSFSLVNQGGLYFTADIKKIDPNASVDLALPANAEQSSFVSLMLSKTEAEKIGGVRPSLTNSTEDKRNESEPSNSLEDPSRGLKILFQNFIGLLKNVSTDEAAQEKTNLNEGFGGLSLARHSEQEPTPLFLEIVPRPTVSGDKISVTPPPMVEGVEPVATFVVLSEIQRQTKGRYNIEQRFRLWEIAQFGWTNELQLPKSNITLDPNKNYRWEVLFMGRRSGHNSGDSGEYFLDDITHVSRNSFDF